jgi:hypothetical protein
MSASTSASGLFCLYEAQTSVVVTGTDNWVWTAYGIVDTYFGSKESVQRYHKQNGPSAQVDPLAAGQIPAIPSISLIWTPREYFSKIVAIRMNEARRAWREIIYEVESSVKQYVYCEGFPTLFTCCWASTGEAKMEFFLSFVKIIVIWKGSRVANIRSHRARTNHIMPKPSKDASRQAARNYSDWCTEMVELLRRLTNRLSDFVACWDEFRGGKIGYFNDGESTAVLSPLKDSMGAVNKAFSDLREILRKLRDLERELCEDCPQGVSHSSWTDMDANQNRCMLTCVLKGKKPPSSSRKLQASCRFLPLSLL